VSLVTTGALGLAVSAGLLAGVSTEAGATTSGVTKNSITVGGIVIKTSASGYTTSATTTGFKAAITQQNQAGGVYGRKINFVGTLDDQLTPSTDLAVTHRLVDQYHVFAVAPINTAVFSAGGTYLQQQGIPYFGWGTTEIFCNNQYGFGFNGCLDSTSSADKISTAPGGLMASVYKKAGTNPKGLTAAVVGNSSAGNVAALPGQRKAFEASGFNVVYGTATIPATAAVADWSPWVNPIMTSNNGKPPAVVYAFGSTTEANGLSTALKAAGYKGKFLDAVSYSNQTLSNPQLLSETQTRYTWLPVAPFNAPNAGVRSMVKALVAVGMTKSKLTQTAAIGYWTGKLFIAALQKAGQNLTHASFLKAANHLTYGVTGAYGPVSFPAQHTNASPCGAMVQLKGKRFIPTVPLTCYLNVSP